MASTFISLPSSTISGPIDVTIDPSGDSVKITDGTDTLAINPDGSINVNGTSGPSTVDAVYVGLNQYEYNEIMGLAIGATSTVVSHTFATDYKLRKINCTGDNIAVWTVVIDTGDIDKRRSSYTNLNCDFDYETGITVPGGSTVYVTATNAGNSVADFSARLLFSPK